MICITTIYIYIYTILSKCIMEEQRFSRAKIYSPVGEGKG